MNIAELKGEKTVKALVKRLLGEQPKGRAKKTEAEMEAALLRVNPHLNQIDSLEKLEFVPGAITGLKILADAGFTLVMVSNQDGLGSAGYPRKNFRYNPVKV